MPYGSPPAILTETPPQRKTTAMTAAGALTGTEIVALVQGGVNVRSTAAAIAALAVTTPAAPVNSLQFNNAGAFGGSANATFDGVNTTTLHTATVSTGNLTVTPGNITTGAATNLNLKTSGGTQAQIGHVASAVNFVEILGRATGNPPRVGATGSDANVGLNYSTKGTGQHLFFTSIDSGGRQQFAVVDNAAANGNALPTMSANAGSAIYSATGNAATVSAEYLAKSAGTHTWRKDATTNQPIFQLGSVAGTAATYMVMTSGPSGTAPAMQATSTVDTAVHARIDSQGNAGTGTGIQFGRRTSSFPMVFFLTAEALNTQLQISTVSNAIAFSMAGQGGLVNANMTFTPLGTGSVVINPGSGTTLPFDSSTATTVNLFATPTTVNIGAAATTLALGAATGTATIANATVTLSNAATLNVNGANPTIAGSSAGTLTLFNTNLTTVNAFGAATTIAMGAGAVQMKIGTDPGGTNTLRVGGALTVNSAVMIATKTAFTNNAGAGAGTITNAPAAGNPTKWIPIDDNGTTRNIPAW